MRHAVQQDRAAAAACGILFLKKPVFSWTLFGLPVVKPSIVSQNYIASFIGLLCMYNICTFFSSMNSENSP